MNRPRNYQSEGSWTKIIRYKNNTNELIHKTERLTDFNKLVVTKGEGRDRSGVWD